MNSSADNGERINKFIALQLGIARREADLLIEEKRVTLDGATATFGQRIYKDSRVTVDDKDINNTTPDLVYISLYKPTGYVCSRRRQGDTPTVYELLPDEYQPLKLVGRLDKDSSGIILLTNDGDFAHRMTHPKFNKTKIYEVELDAALQPLHQQMISDYGVTLDDGKSKFLLERLHDGNSNDWRITMSEGRNRQIRRTFAALGYTVTALHRTRFGNFSLGELSAGKHQAITP